jgi:DNA-binding transcriptional ArsR family regulator
LELKINQRTGMADWGEAPRGRDALPDQVGIDMQVFTCIFCPRGWVRTMDADNVFKALGDPTRRKLLDLLCEKNGQTLGQLCDNLDMARQSATQHLGILEAANLVTTVRRGREKLHFINPVPLHEVYERWVRKFERQRLSLLHDLKKELEGE